MSYSNVSSATVKILSTRDMSPSANIVVYFVREDGEIIADSLKVTVNGPFENMVGMYLEVFLGSIVVSFHMITAAV